MTSKKIYIKPKQCDQTASCYKFLPTSNDPMGNYTGTSIYGDPEQDVDDL